jgi:hypothetical protein
VGGHARGGPWNGPPTARSALCQPTRAPGSIARRTRATGVQAARRHPGAGAARTDVPGFTAHSKMVRPPPTGAAQTLAAAPSAPRPSPSARGRSRRRALCGGHRNRRRASDARGASGHPTRRPEAIAGATVPRACRPRVGVPAKWPRGDVPGCYALRRPAQHMKDERAGTGRGGQDALTERKLEARPTTETSVAGQPAPGLGTPTVQPQSRRTRLGGRSRSPGVAASARRAAELAPVSVGAKRYWRTMPQVVLLGCILSCGCWRRFAVRQAFRLPPSSSQPYLFLT